MLYREVIAVCPEIHSKHINVFSRQNVEFLGAFAKLQKVTISFPMSVHRPHGTPTGGIFMKCNIWIFFFFSKICRENLKFRWSVKGITGTSQDDLCTFMIIYRWIPFRMKNVSHNSCREDRNTHFMFKNFFPENRAVCEKMWKKCGRARQVTDDNILRMRVACLMSNAACACSQYLNVLISHCNNGCTNAPHCYVIRAMPVFLSVKPGGT